MPSYDYICEAGHEHEEVFLSFKEAEEYENQHPCPAEGCEKVGRRAMSGGTTLSFIGHFQGERIKNVDRRKQRQEVRFEEKIKKGEMTDRQVEQAAAIRDKFAKTSPYTLDPQEAKSNDPKTQKKRVESGGHFHDEETMVVQPRQT